MRTTSLLTLLALFNLTFSAPAPASTPLPLVVWHGLGDRFDNAHLLAISKLANKVHPGTKTHIISLADDGASDQRATFFGNVTAQIDSVCTTLTSSPFFNASTTRIDALGFSQGGQFLRGLIERCPGISVRSLVTFGSQHNGIAQFQVCGDWDLLCKGATAAVKGNAWTEWVQSNIVPAQYYRTINETTGLGSEEYLAGSGFIADVNNEREEKREVYKQRLQKLDTFAMYVFENDTTVIPKESGWFAEVNATDGTVWPLRERKIYKEDWIGLKALDHKGGLDFRTVEGAKHMEISEKLLRTAFEDFYGPERHAGLTGWGRSWWQQAVMAGTKDW